MFERAKVVQQYQRLVHQLAKKFCVSAQYEDLIQEGYCGLLEAYDRYDETRGAQFMTFAHYLIFARMQAYCERSIHPVAVSHNAQERMRTARKRSADYQPQITQTEYTDSLMQEHNSEETLNSKIDKKVVWDAIASLSEKQKYILLESVLNDTTLHVIGSTLGISRQRVYQIYVDTLALLQKRIKVNR